MFENKEKNLTMEIETQILNSLNKVQDRDKLHYLFKRCVQAEIRNSRPSLVQLYIEGIKEVVQHYILRPFQKFFVERKMRCVQAKIIDSRLSLLDFSVRFNN